MAQSRTIGAAAQSRQRQEAHAGAEVSITYPGFRDARRRCINFIGLDAMQALYWSAVVMGVIAVPLLAIMIRMASQPEVMGEFTIGKRLQILGWTATAIMASSVGAVGISAYW